MAKSWHRQLTRYHWLVLTVCTLGWSFDCLNQQIFNLVRKPAMAELLQVSTDDPSVTRFGSLSTSLLLIGWATGGIIFGVMGDRIGRVKTFLVMVLCYPISTGLCGLSRGPWEYCFWCFVAGMGAGGIFPVGCALVAESLPDGPRPHALGMLQAFSAFGNIAAGVISLGMIALWSHGVVASHWRWMFFVGVLPALLAWVVAKRLREPEAWKAVRSAGKTARNAGSLKELFGVPRWRRNALVGLTLAVAGVVGLWGIGVFSNDLTQSFIGGKYDDDQRALGEAQKDRAFVALAVASRQRLEEAKKAVSPAQLLGAGRNDTDARRLYEAALKLEAAKREVSPAAVLAALSAPDKDGRVPTAEDRQRWATIVAGGGGSESLGQHVERIAARQKARGVRSLQWAAVTLIMFNIGAFFGIYAFARITPRLGRRPTFALAFAAAGLATASAFLFMSSTSDIFWMAPLMGACQLSVFGGYAIYFPELFPTRLRSTGTSFCYNVGRYVAATGPLGLGWLTRGVFFNPGNPLLSFRHAGVAMCGCFLVGMAALLFAPETKGQPLPE